MSEKIIPKKIWILWLQGLSNAPFIVKRCVDSWIKENPTWEINILDSTNLSSYINLDIPESVFQSLSLNHKSDLIRLKLLSEYGGVWADATTYCTKPLDMWLDECVKSGFFVFYKPGRDRLLSSWFIVSQKQNFLIMELCKLFKSYWVKNNFKKPNKIQRILIGICTEIFNRHYKTTKLWLHPIVTKLFKIYPYFIFHYCFYKLISKDKQCRSIWENTKKISADPSHIILRRGMFSTTDKEIKQIIKSNETPIFKLTWEADISKYAPETLLYYLLEEEK